MSHPTAQESDNEKDQLERKSQPAIPDQISGGDSRGNQVDISEKTGLLLGWHLNSSFKRAEQTQKKERMDLIYEEFF